MNDWLILLKLAALFLCLFALAELLYHALAVKAEFTRKLVHIGTGLLTLLFPVYLTHLWQVIIICVAFLLILFLSLHFHFLQSVNAIQRKTAGSVLFPVIVCGIFWFYTIMATRNTILHSYTFFYMPVLIMAIADPVAALAGNYFSKRTGKKTVAGSLAFLITAFIISGLFFCYWSALPIQGIILYAWLIAAITTLSERMSNHGWDNFTIPATTAILLYLIV